MPIVRNVAGILGRWAVEKPGARALVFLSSRGTVEAELGFGEFWTRANAVSGELARRARRGDVAALLFPPGLDFLVAFFGCLLAGVIALPMPTPRRSGRRDSTTAILANARPRFVLTTRAFAATLSNVAEQRDAWDDLEWLAVDDLPPVAEAAPPPVAVDDETVAFIQYTSGSTSSPKGVTVGHANLLANLGMMQQAFGTSERSAVACWMPLFHDMGLIANALHAVFIGAPCILMAPMTFMQRPLTWLKAISDYRVDFAGGPNFAFDHCVDRLRPDRAHGIDLSSWRVAINGAEPVRAGTIERFADAFSAYGFDRGAMYPCYGMAEATVMVSGRSRPAGVVLHRGDAGTSAVGCGPALAGEEIAIADPATGVRLPAGATGEIWVRGANVARGYWRDDRSTGQSFDAELQGHGGGWLRTGDLGLLDGEGELFVTGRLKELLIVRGRNYYPQDIELTVKSCHPALARQTGVAFVTLARHGMERLVVVQEMERVWRDRGQTAALEARVREAVAEEHELAVHRIVIVPPGSIPRTTSGKIRRVEAKLLWQTSEPDPHGDAP